MPTTRDALPRSSARFRRDGASSPARSRARALGGLILAVAALAGPLAAPAVGASRPVVVAVHGADSASGDVEHPLATVRAAVARLPHGGVVRLRHGVYHQR